MERPIRAVLFDVGDTLRHLPEEIPEDEIRAVSARQVARVLAGLEGGASVDAAAFVRHLGEAVFPPTGGRTVRPEDLEYRSPDYVGLVRALLAEYGVTATPGESREVWHAWFAPPEVLGVRCFPDAADTLRWLRERGYRLGCVTNRPLGGEPFLRDMASHGLRDLFDAWAISCDLGYEKPHPAIFQCALDGLGVEARQAVMVGDSLRADVEGAQRLGMTAVWKRPRRVPEEDAALVRDGVVRPDFTIDRLEELRHLPVFRATEFQ